MLPLTDAAEAAELAFHLLSQKITIPSFSCQEDSCTDWFSFQLNKLGLTVERLGNNLIVQVPATVENAPTVAFISHIDTVKPHKAWQTNPHEAIIEGDKLIGLGVNDAGASLFAMTMATAEYAKQGVRAFTLKFIVACEEENGGNNGLPLVNVYHTYDYAVIGEPTMVQAATAERGLLVVDVSVTGKASHVGQALYPTVITIGSEIVQKVAQLPFKDKYSSLGPSRAFVSVFHAGEQHNTMPAEAHLVIDVRLNEHTTTRDALALIKNIVPKPHEFKARSLNKGCRFTSHESLWFPLVKGLKIGTFGSSTLSDWSRVPEHVPTIKLGPGSSTRSHTVGEFIHKSELKEGIETYLRILNALPNHFPEKGSEAV